MSENRVHFFIRLPELLKREIQRVAQRHGRSTTKEVQKVLENHVEKCGATEPHDSELIGISR
jgi:hypothetical protein